jgi:hypothetical protein
MEGVMEDGMAAAMVILEEVRRGAVVEAMELQ